MDIAAEMAAIADQRDASGKKRFSHEDIVHFLPILILGARLDFKRYPVLDSLMQKFAEAAGLRIDMAADEALALVRSYYRRRPPNRHLAYAFVSLAREITGEGASISAAPEQDTLSAAPGPASTAPALAQPASTPLLRSLSSLRS